MPIGNQSLDAWEFYWDKNKNGRLDSDSEPYADLMFKNPELTEPIRKLKPWEKLIIGQSSDFSRNRYTLMYEPNSWLNLTGDVPKTMLVRVMEKGADARAYTTSVIEGRIYIGLPTEPATGSVEVWVPGGRQVWSESIASLQELFINTVDQNTLLSSVAVNKEDWPKEAGIAVDVLGDPDRTGFMPYASLYQSGSVETISAMDGTSVGNGLLMEVWSGLDITVKMFLMIFTVVLLMVIIIIIMKVSANGKRLR